MRIKELMARKTRKKAAARSAPKRKSPARKRSGSRKAAPLKWHWRYSLAVVVAGFAALAWMSLLSYSATDPPASLSLTPVEVVTPATSASQPSSRPASRPATHPGGPYVTIGGPETVIDADRVVLNSAGVIGAYTAHWLLWCFGGASYVGLTFLTIGALGLAIHGRVPLLPLRIAGVCLLMAATASGAFLLEADGDGGSAIGPPGVLGSSVGGVLLAQLAQSGGWIIVAMTAIVGTIMTAGRLIFIPLRLAKRAWLAIVERIREARRKSALAAQEAAERAPEPEPAKEPRATMPQPDQPVVDRRSITEEITRRLKDRAQEAETLIVEDEGPPLPSGPGYEESFEPPTMDLLAESPEDDNESEQEEALRRRDVIQTTLNAFGVEAEVVAHHVGPVVTMFELSLAAGVKVSRVTALDEDIARALATSAVRVVSPLPGRDTIGIEMPNIRQQVVRIRQMLDSDDLDLESMALPVVLGKNAGGEAIVTDLAAMPHLLIAGTTGSGKSVCLNAMLLSLLVTRRPSEVRMVLVDPKMVEMAAYDGIPHLLCPPVSDMSQAAGILEWATVEMDKRYMLLRDARVRHITEFNELEEEDRRAVLGIKTPEPEPEPEPEPSAETEQPDEADQADQAEETPEISTRMPYYIVVVDELADLIMTASKEVESHIIRIAQKARAVGIHLVLATQRPSVKVVTGLIKANMPCRISFRVASRVESRIILDQNGAESLVGKGDMLLLKPGESLPIRAQGVFVANKEIRAVVDDLCSRSSVIHHPDLTEDSEPELADEPVSIIDELLPQAAETVVSYQRGSAALLQRRLSIGFTQATELANELTTLGILGPARGSQARECLITLEEWHDIEAAL
jgi:DNA segregation ATPase FtsK/SpoIIIE, S-DNA-T family